MCDCIKRINRALADHNAMLETNWLSDPPRAMISICKQASHGKKPPLMEATHCPFCGDKYPEKTRDLARDLAVRT